MSEMEKTKQEAISRIVDEIYLLQTPKVADSRRTQIQESLTTSINGGVIQKHLVISATIGTDKGGVLVYVLTDVKFIKIEIGSQEGNVLASSYILSTFTGITREFIENGSRISINITFGPNSVILRYAPSNQKITDFFQDVEKLASSKLSNA